MARVDSAQGETTDMQRMMARLGTLVMLVAFAAPAGAHDENPCGDQYWHDGFQKQVQDCAMWRGAVPVYEERWHDASQEPIGYLWNARGNWFVCERQGSTYGVSGYLNDWWAYTLADNGEWGWVPEVYFSGGDDFEPDGGLVHC
jgi:hypothetical protein